VRICVDAGHGGHDSGAVGPTGLRESVVNLTAACLLREKLRMRGHDVVMTRDNNTRVPLDRRCRISDEHQVDVFCSLHCNDDGRRGLGRDSSEDLGMTGSELGMTEGSDLGRTKRAHGFEVWTTPGDTGADRIAEAVIGEIAGMQVLHGRYDRADGDRDKEARFYVLRHTKSPAILVEMAFISNPEEETMLREEEFLECYAGAIARGIEEGMKG